MDEATVLLHFLMCLWSWTTEGCNRLRVWPWANAGIRWTPRIICNGSINPNADGPDPSTNPIWQRCFAFHPSTWPGSWPNHRNHLVCHTHLRTFLEGLLVLSNDTGSTQKSTGTIRIMASPCTPMPLSCRRRAACAPGVWGLKRKPSAQKSEKRKTHLSYRGQVG